MSGARIRMVGNGEGGLVVRAVFAGVRRALKKILGRAEVAAPYRLLAHSPGVLVSYAQLERSLVKTKAVPFDLRELARARVSTLVGCRW